MKINTTILLVLLVALLNACEGQKNYIIETDLSLFAPDTVNGETVAQSNQRGARLMEMLKSNTVNKYLPEIMVYDSSGQEVNLQNVIVKKTIIVSSDAYCGFGKESLTNDFPRALDSLKSELQDYDIVCLVKRIDVDLENNLRFEAFKTELQEIYQSVYIIDESEAYKLNFFGNPARLYINEDQKVKFMSVGLPSVANQIKEIRANTDAR